MSYINVETSGMENMRVRLSILWVFLTLNYLYADVFSIMEAPVLQELLTGSVGGIQVTQEFLLGASFLMEIPMAMVVLSRLLSYRANRWANIIAGAIMALVQIASLFFGYEPTYHYIFFSIVEISCSSYIVWLAWGWMKTGRAVTFPPVCAAL